MKSHNRFAHLVRLILLLAISSTLLLGGSPSLAAPHHQHYIVRVMANQRAAVQSLAHQAFVTIDYGAFDWMVFDEAALDALQTANPDVQIMADPYTLVLGEVRFDPLLAMPDLPAGWQTSTGSGSDLRLVQFWGPTKANWLSHLRANGLQIVQYIHPYTYVVWGQRAELNSARALDTVRWTGEFAPAYRVLPQWRDLPSGRLDVDVLIYRGSYVDSVVQAFEELNAVLRGRAILNQTWELVGFSINGDQLQAAAAIPGVYSIQPVPTDGGLRGEMSNQINVNNHDGSNLAFPGYQTWLTSIGLDGMGVIMANVDGGVQHMHPDLVNRIVSCSGDTCGGGATSDHGTHTAGIMAADGSSSVLDSYGFLRGLGMAPGANLVEQVYSPWYTQPGGMLKLIRESYQNNAVLSSNSWGPSGSPQGYDDDTMQVDIGVRDAQDSLSGNQSFSYVLSFMNGGGGTSTQGSPDEAKNIFTIGSTKLQNINGSQNLDINDLSSNTAHGPALDGRTIPHMVAPGCQVDSTVSGSAHALICGTSMASPHVSGAVGLFFEYYRNLFGVDPSPALVKAAFLPVAHDLAGHLDADGGVLGHPFDSKQGWGRMDTATVLDPQVPVLYFDNPTIFDNTAEIWQQIFFPADPAQPMRLMLVWTDAPGHGLGGSTPAWNNDLDLVVSYAGNTYYGNRFDANGWSDTGGSPDGMNNTEGVFLGPTVSKAVTVQVLASNITSDGIPNQGDDTDQDFALVCYNCQAGASGTLTGQVTDISSGDPIEGAVVSADGLSASTAASGIYSLTLPVGAFTVTAQHIDYYSQTITSVNVHTDTITVQDFALTFHPQAGLNLSPGSSSQTGMPGETVTHSYTLINTGNITDSYSLVVTGNNWMTMAPATTGDLGPGAVTDVEVVVTIPDDPALRAIIANDDFILIATSDFDGSVSAQATGRTYANVEPGIEISPASQMGSGAPGQVVTYTYQITNTGDYTDSFSLDLNGNIWPTVVADSTGELRVNESLEIDVWVMIPTDPAMEAIISSDEFILTVVSGLDGDVSAKATGETQLQAEAGIEIDPQAASQLSLPGEVATYTYMISNAGEYADIFGLTISSTWTATLSATSTGALGVGEAFTITLMVEIPTNATDGMRDLATLTVTSVLDAAIYATATAETMVPITEFKIFLPLTRR